MSFAELEGRMMASMQAMVLDAPRTPLVMRERPVPVPGVDEILVAVAACGVCRTDLHVVDGELEHPRLPIVPGHEIVGRVAATGVGVSGFAIGERVGVPWLGATCGTCPYCRGVAENLCDTPVFTGFTRDGGYATHTVADARFAFPLAGNADPAEQAPLLCAGLIGWRSYRMAGVGRALGLYGFGAAAHILAQVATWQGRRVYAFTRGGDKAAQDFARSLGAVWAGGAEETPPEPLDAAIIFAPVGALVPTALRAVKKGGRVVCGGIHMSDIPSFPYRILWEERQVVSVANLTRADAHEFLAIAPKAGLRIEVVRYPLSQANEALADLREGRLQGAAVLIP
jgi:propanol-preferring alcohol dehydrogenase